jgi:hypothetical protein
MSFLFTMKSSTGLPFLNSNLKVGLKLLTDTDHGKLSAQAHYLFEIPQLNCN